MKELSKKLNIIEAMKMPIGTLFEVYDDGIKDSCNAKIVAVSQKKYKKELVWDNRAYIPIHITNCSCDSIFIPIQQPVSFMEAITSKKRVKVECDGYRSIDKYYYRVGEIFEIIVNSNKEYGNETVDKAIKSFITKGKWYIEESEELEDERLSK